MIKFWFKYQKWTSQGQLKDQNCQLNDQNCQNLSAMMKYIENDNGNVEIMSYSRDFWLNSINFWSCPNSYCRNDFDLIGQCRLNDDLNLISNKIQLKVD